MVYNLSAPAMRTVSLPKCHVDASGEVVVVGALPSLPRGHLRFYSSIGHLYKYTRAPLRGRLTPPATLAQGIFQLNVKGAERRDP